MFEPKSKHKIKDILAHPGKPWNWWRLSANPSITIEDVLAHPNRPWDWKLLSENPNITMKDVLAYPDKPWDWGYLSENPNITINDILANADKPWDWGWLSRNKFLHHPILQLNAIKKLSIIRIKYRRETYLKILKSSNLYNDLINVVIGY